jgi:hypothetical protein
MREWIKLFEASGTVTLYRGDSETIERFEVAKTKEWGLFGQGIYLTDSPDIAGDYTVKDVGGDDIEYRANERNDELIPYTTQDLMRNYLRKIMAELGFDEAVEKLKKEYQANFYKARGDLDWSDSSKAEENRAVEKKLSQEFNEAFKIARSKAIRVYVDKAKAVFKNRRPNLRIVKLTTGEYVLAKPNRSGSISKFEVPENYVARVVHTDRPLSDEVLKIVKELFLDGKEDRPMDLRAMDGHQETMGHTFDSYVSGFKKHGARYAWTDSIFGGKGENPSLDILWNGTHAGTTLFHKKENQYKLMSALQNSGYVGLQYDGGIKLAGAGARGGGAIGVLHNAYVFWNDDDINSFRVANIPVQDDEVGPIEKGIRANSILR